MDWHSLTFYLENQQEFSPLCYKSINPSSTASVGSRTFSYPSCLPQMFVQHFCSLTELSPGGPCMIFIISLSSHFWFSYSTRSFGESSHYKDKWENKEKKTGEMHWEEWLNRILVSTQGLWLDQRPGRWHSSHWKPTSRRPPQEVSIGIPLMSPWHLSFHLLWKTWKKPT